MGETQEQHDANLKRVIDKLQAHNVKINKEKSVLNKMEINFLGHIISGKGISPDKRAVEALRSAEYPVDKKELQSWLGSLQFYSKFIKNLGEKIEPLYRMMRKQEEFIMGPTQRICIDHIKDCLLSPLLLKPYEPNKPVTLTCDASQKGIGAVLEQDGRPVITISKMLTPAEINYSQIEREGLAIVWAVKKLSKFLVGKQFTLITDHKPLQYIFSPQKSLNNVTSARLQRWALILMNYDFHIMAVKSEDLPLSDLLSRCGQKYNEENISQINTIFETPLPKLQHELIRIFKEEKWVKLKNYIRTGFPNVIDNRLSAFKKVKNDLTIEGNLIYKNRQLIIPEELQHIILAEIHKEHFGLEKTKQYARAYFYWPGMTTDIENLVRNCHLCLTYKPKSICKQEWSPWPAARRPMERVHIDFGEKDGHPFLVVVDAFTKWPEIFPTRDMVASTVIRCLRQVFSRFGIAETLVSDNGPSLIAKEVENWLSQIGCTHITSPDYHPKSNGLAERMVRTIKEHLKVTRTVNIALSIERFLFSYRSIPHATTKLSPSIMMLGREIHTSAAALQNSSYSGYAHNPLANKYKPGNVVQQNGKVVSVEMEDGAILRRHIDQFKALPKNSTKGQSDLEDRTNQAPSATKECKETSSEFCDQEGAYTSDNNSTMEPSCINQYRNKEHQLVNEEATQEQQEETNSQPIKRWPQRQWKPVDRLILE